MAIKYNLGTMDPDLELYHEYLERRNKERRKIARKGGPGSGHFQHTGRKGKIGGSSPGGGGKKKYKRHTKASDFPEGGDAYLAIKEKGYVDIDDKGFIKPSQHPSRGISQQEIDAMNPKEKKAYDAIGADLAEINSVFEQMMRGESIGKRDKEILQIMEPGTYGKPGTTFKGYKEKAAEKDTYTAREKKVAKMTGSTEREIHNAVEKAYTGKSLTKVEKNILQVGWPEIHGKAGTPFKK